MTLKPPSRPDALNKYAHFLENYDKGITVKVSTDQHTQIEKIAIDTKCSFSAIVRVALQFFIDNFNSQESGGGENA